LQKTGKAWNAVRRHRPAGPRRGLQFAREGVVIRLISYMAATAASALGWRLGQMWGPLGSVVCSCFAAGAALYFTRRWLRDSLGL
jgi:hypothetical protein